jgi:hypothetical protein
MVPVRFEAIEPRHEAALVSAASSVTLVRAVHATNEWEGALAVHAREGPELEQDEAVAKGREPQRLAVCGVEPRIDADEFRSVAQDGQPMRSSHDSVDGGGRTRSPRSRCAMADRAYRLPSRRPSGVGPKTGVA